MNAGYDINGRYWIKLRLIKDHLNPDGSVLKAGTDAWYTPGSSFQKSHAPIPFFRSKADAEKARVERNKRVLDKFKRNRLRK